MVLQEEDELHVLRSQRRQFEELRHAEQTEQQRLAEQHRRLDDEKRRRQTQNELREKEQLKLAEKLAALFFAKSYLADLIPVVFGTLSVTGYFYDSVEKGIFCLCPHSLLPPFSLSLCTYCLLSILYSLYSPLSATDIEERFMPNLIEGTVDQVKKQVVARILLDSFIRQVTVQRVAKAQEALLRRREIRLGTRLSFACIRCD